MVPVTAAGDSDRLFLAESAPFRASAADVFNGLPQLRDNSMTMKWSMSVMVPVGKILPTLVVSLKRYPHLLEENWPSPERKNKDIYRVEIFRNSRLLVMRARGDSFQLNSPPY